MGGEKKTIPVSYKVRLSLNAIQNIYDITEYISFVNHQPHNAANVGDTILSTIDRIKQNPYAFRECFEIPTKTKMYRRAICLSWTIIYKIAPPEIVILGVIHGSRKPSVIRMLRKIK